MIWLVFGQTLSYQFINFDDTLYVTANPLVTAGLTPHGIARVFTHFETRFYTPLTMISHMADFQVHRLWAGGHHLTNVLIHTATALLLFLILRQMTGETCRAAFVAAIFAIHPLHVESVAWVSERNDLLAGLFFALTIAAYLCYVRRPSSWHYLVVLACFVAGLLSKPTLVTLPFILLILDGWPLGRFGKPGLPVSRLILEKAPLLALSIAAGVAAYFAEGKSVAGLEAYPIGARVSNAIVSCVIYLRQMVWPSGLAVFYPRPADGWGVWEVVGASAILICISVAVFLLRKRSPYLLAGWLWYLVMLAPVIGIVQVGEFAHADRYTYLSQIGLYIALAWGVADLKIPAWALGGAAYIVICALITCAYGQTAYWRDSESIFRHALDCTVGNYLACNNLGSALEEKGDFDEAIAIYQEGLAFRPSSSPLHDNLGRALYKKGDVDGAIREYQRALEIDPQSAPARYNMATALSSVAWTLATSPDDSVRNGNEAVSLAMQANQLSSGTDPIVLRALGAAYAETRHFEEAAAAALRGAEICDSRGDTALGNELRREAESYRQGKPLRAIPTP